VLTREAASLERHSWHAVVAILSSEAATQLAACGAEKVNPEEKRREPNKPARRLSQRQPSTVGATSSQTSWVRSLSQLLSALRPQAKARLASRGGPLRRRTGAKLVCKNCGRCLCRGGGVGVQVALRL
jgi:hypothetical protein